MHTPGWSFQIPTPLGNSFNRVVYMITGVISCLCWANLSTRFPRYKVNCCSNHSSWLSILLSTLLKAWLTWYTNPTSWIWTFPLHWGESGRLARLSTFPWNNHQVKSLSLSWLRFPDLRACASNHHMRVERLAVERITLAWVSHFCRREIKDADRITWGRKGLR